MPGQGAFEEKQVSGAGRGHIERGHEDGRFYSESHQGKVFGDDGHHDRPQAQHNS